MALIFANGNSTHLTTCLFVRGKEGSKGSFQGVGAATNCMGGVTIVGALSVEAQVI